MAVRKIKGSWWVDFQVNQRRHRKRSPENTKMGAEAYEAVLRQKLARGESIEVSAPTEAEDTFSIFSRNWFLTYVTTNNKPSERDNKRKALNGLLVPYFGNLRLSEITPQKIEGFKAAQIARGIKAKTINNLLAILRKCLNTAVEWEALVACPRIKPLKVENPKYKYLTEQESNLLLKVAPEGLWRVMVLTALRTGMRFSELVGLEWESVDLFNRQICVRRANVRGYIGTPKSNKSRYIPMTKDLHQALSTLPRTNKLVFPYQNTWMRHEAGRLHLAEFCRRAGIQIVAWHALRHTFASRLASSGVPLNSVQQLLGHSTITMTMRYSHLNQNDLRRAVSVLEKPENAVGMSTWRQPDEISLEKLFQNFNTSTESFRST